MKKICTTFFLALLALAVFITPASAARQDMHAYVYKWTGNYNADGSPGLTAITSGITFKVLAVDSNTAETLYVYNDKKLTSLTNPVSTANFASTTVCNKQVAFAVDPTDSTNDRDVDLIVVDTAGGYTAVVKGFNKYQRTIIIDERPNVRHHGVIWYEPTTASATATGITFQTNAFIEDVRVEVVTTESGGTINVGTGGAATGFRSGVSMTTAGYIADTGVITNGSTVDYTPATTYGSLLYTSITGSDTTISATGGRSYIGYITGSSTTTLYYTVSTTTSSPKGYIHYFITRLR